MHSTFEGFAGLPASSRYFRNFIKVLKVIINATTRSETVALIC